MAAGDRLGQRVAARIPILLQACGIIVLASLLAVISLRFDYRADWTRHGRHTLSEASIRTVERLRGPVEITAYARDQAQLREAVDRFVDPYRRLHPDLTLRFVNPDAVPDEVRRLGITVNGEMVIRYDDRLEHVRAGSEEDFTNALQRLLRGTERWLAFLEGHGEREPLGESGSDLRAWARQLSSRGFRYTPINLARIGAIPDNTSVLIIAAPRVDLLPGEADRVINYLARGGRLLWLGDPGELHGLEPLAGYLGMAFAAGTVIDPNAAALGLDDPTLVTASADRYGDHPVVRGLGLSTLFPGATALSTTGAGGWTAAALVQSSAQAWVETGALQGTPAFDPEQAIHGPLDLALALERELPGAGETVAPGRQRAVITGDGDFLSNTHIASGGNLELGLRMINWLAGDEDFISIPAPVSTDTDLSLSPLASGFIGIGFLVALPLGLLGCGALVWSRRRRL